ncbi:MAG: 50S ribosomal protein L13 [Polyangiales bacterium]|nr:50S ribosomal protein L13 [Myxococcales bacterium]
MRTLSAKESQIDRTWYVIDATDQPLGRLASRVATVLRGKHRPDYTPHADVGDFVVIVNAEKVRLTGTKASKTVHYRHSGTPGGLTSRTFGEEVATAPDRFVERVVKGMLPKTSLGRRQLRKLKVYAGAAHPHTAQQPQPFNF